MPVGSRVALGTLWSLPARPDRAVSDSRVHAETAIGTDEQQQPRGPVIASGCLRLSDAAAIASMGTSEGAAVSRFLRA